MTVASNFVGLIMHNVPQYKTGHAEIILGNGGPILVYQISSTCTRVLVDVPSQAPADLKEYMASTIAPQLPGILIAWLHFFMINFFEEHIQGPFLESLKEQRLRMMPNSFLPPQAIHKPGIVRINGMYLPVNLSLGVLILGDAFNMRHPLTGAGMSVALNDVVLLRQALQDMPSLSEQSVISLYIDCKIRIIIQLRSSEDL